MMIARPGQSCRLVSRVFVQGESGSFGDIVGAYVI